MQILIGVTLTAFLVFIVIVSYRRTKDVFSPLVFFGFFQILRYCTGLFYKTEEMGVRFEDDNLLRFFFIESIAIWSLLIGYYIHQKYFYHPSIVYEEKFQKQQRQIPGWVIFLVYLVGLSGRIRGIVSYGGLGFVLGNTRQVYLSGNVGSGYSSLLDQLMIVGIIMQMKRISGLENANSLKRIISYFLLLIMIGISMGSYLIYSRRSPALELLMLVIFAYNYLIKGIRIKDAIKPRTILIFIAIISIIVVMPAIRQGQNAVFRATNILDEFSYLGRDIGSYEYFSQNEKWFGKSYTSLIFAPIPSALYENKPPVDDGMYLYNILRGNAITPPVPVNNIAFYNSYPFSTQGILYANFGVLGVIIGELLMGFLYARTYKKLLNTRSDFMVIAYQLVIYQLELSSLSIVQTLIPLIVSFIVYKVVTGFKIYKVRVNYSENLYP